MASSSGSGNKRSPSPGVPRRIVVTHRLPLRAEPNPGARHGFDFSLDRDALQHQLSRGLPHPVVFVGALPSAAASIPNSEELASDLLERFSCSPVFLDADNHDKFYGEFCKHYLWPMLHYHYLIPVSGSPSLRNGVRSFEENLYRAYLTANTQFAERVVELLNPDEDLVFIHDYHLMALPTILRHKSPRARVSFFLHSPFPASEIFRMMPCREDLLRGLLNADLVGFQTYDYARHFLSACSRLLGFSNHSKNGYICIDYYGRIDVKILSVGVEMSQLRHVLALPETAAKAREISTKYKGRKLFLGVDDIDLFKGIRIKLSAMEKLLMSHTELRGKVVLVQIINPAQSPGSDIDAIHTEVHAMRDRINSQFGLPGYDPIVVIDDPLLMHEKLAFYTAANICVVTAVRDGLNRMPYIYTVCRQEGPIAGSLEGAPRESTIIVSEFVGCSPSLSGAIRINPWNEDEVVDAMHQALKLGERDRQIRHEKHYRYVITHDIATWTTSLDQDLQKACKDHASMNILCVGFAMNFRVVVLGPNFRKLLPVHINPAYHQASNRLILLDYDGTVKSYEMMNKAPSQELISVLNRLCSDPNNVVFLVSGRGKDELTGWFAQCERLGIAAEHGYFTRWNNNSPWELANLALNSDWKKTARPMMQLYTDTTQGSYIEAKDTALVWHYEEADANFGLCQSKELKDHLQSMLGNHPVYVKSGHQIVEVIPQGVSKGITVENLIATMTTRGTIPDFILCVGDDRSDEDMFEAITSPKSSSAVPDTAEIFACTVGYKPSSAKYFLEEPSDVLKMLEGLTISPTSDPVASQSQVFEDSQE